MSEKKIIRQLREAPDCCPWCDSSANVDTFDIEDVAGKVIQHFHCDGCAGGWSVEYKPVNAVINTIGCPESLVVDDEVDDD